MASVLTFLVPEWLLCSGQAFAILGFSVVWSLLVLPLIWLVARPAARRSTFWKLAFRTLTTSVIAIAAFVIGVRGADVMLTALVLGLVTVAAMLFFALPRGTVALRGNRRFTLACLFGNDACRDRRW